MAEIAIDGLKLGLALLITGGLGVGIFRIGTLIGVGKGVSDDVVEMKTDVKDFRKANDESHGKLHQEINDTGKRLVAVETQLTHLPCNGRKNPSCPVGGG